MIDSIGQKNLSALSQDNIKDNLKTHKDPSIKEASKISTEGDNLVDSAEQMSDLQSTSSNYSEDSLLKLTNADSPDNSSELENESEKGEVSKKDKILDFIKDHKFEIAILILLLVAAIAAIMVSGGSVVPVLLLLGATITANFWAKQAPNNKNQEDQNKKLETNDIPKSKNQETTTENTKDNLLDSVEQKEKSLPQIKDTDSLDNPNINQENTKDSINETLKKFAPAG